MTWWPAAANGSPLFGYTITPITNGVARPPTNVGGASTSANVVGLTPGTEYTFAVTPRNVFGPGGTGTSVPITFG